MPRYLLLVLMLLASTQPSHGEIAEPACQIAGFSTDSDPNGANIRAAPRTDAAVLARLPAAIRHDGQSFAVEFRIRAVQDGWVQIADAAFGDYFVRRPRFHFTGPGWVHASLVGLHTGSHRLRALPRSDAASVLALRGADKAGNGWGPDSVTVRRLHGCTRQFADVTVRLPGRQEARGWVRNVCANQVTTCDGGDSDEDYE